MTGHPEEPGNSSLFGVVVEGEFYKEGSSDPWKGGTYTAVVSAEGASVAIIEVFEGLGDHGHIESEGGDTDVTVFESERELVVRVSPVRVLNVSPISNPPPDTQVQIESPMSVEDRYLYGNVEAAARVADRLRAAVEHLRACEVEGKAGADDQLVLDALFSYEAFKRANA